MTGGYWFIREVLPTLQITKKVKQIIFISLTAQKKSPNFYTPVQPNRNISANESITNKFKWRSFGKSLNLKKKEAADHQPTVNLINRLEIPTATVHDKRSRINSTTVRFTPASRRMKPHVLYKSRPDLQQGEPITGIRPTPKSREVILIAPIASRFNDAVSDGTLSAYACGQVSYATGHMQTIYANRERKSTRYRRGWWP